MSLIEEALRRAQGGIPHPRVPQPHLSDTAKPAQPSPQSPASTKAFARPIRINPWTRFSLAWLGLGALGVFLLAALLVTYRLHRDRAREIPLPSGVPAMGQTFGPTSSLLQLPASPSRDLVAMTNGPLPHEIPLYPQLTLNGIVEGIGDPFAIINGAIVQLGDMVAGATLMEVHTDFARLRWRDQDLKLRISR